MKHLALLALLAVLPHCSSTADSNDPSDCQNNVTYGYCDPGYYVVEECPGGNCMTEPGCAREYDAICAPRLQVDPATYGDEMCSSSDCYPEVANSCETDADCALAPSGDVCGCVGCDTAAINANYEAQYRQDVATATATHCPDGAECLADCANLVARCDAGTCVAEPAP